MIDMVKVIMCRKNNVKEIIILEFKIYYKVILIKVIWY